MSLKQAICVSILAFAVASCGSGSDAGNTEKSVIPAGQMEALNKAKSVEDSLKAAEEQRRQDMQNSGY